MHHAFSVIALQLGDASERLFDETLRHARRDKKLPPWIRTWEHKQKWSRSDRLGIDFLVRTDRGIIKVDVKSSRIFATIAHKRDKRREVLRIAVNILDPEEKVLKTILDALTYRYKDFSKRAA